MALFLKERSIRNFSVTRKAHSGEKKFLESARSVWEYIKAEIIDKREGSEWYAEVSYDHKPHDWKEIVGPWKCPYHNGRMCMEVINRGVDF